jgi:hypothetical protein
VTFQPPSPLVANAGPTQAGNSGETSSAWLDLANSDRVSKGDANDYPLPEAPDEWRRFHCHFAGWMPSFSRLALTGSAVISLPAFHDVLFAVDLALDHKLQFFFFQDEQRKIL